MYPPAVAVSIAHTKWRKAHTGTPCIKKTIDLKWSAANGGATEVDLIATDYDNLPRDWKHRLDRAAERAWQLVWSAGRDRRPFDDVFIGQVAAAAHVDLIEPVNLTGRAWPHDSSEEESQTPYAERDEVEKALMLQLVRYTIGIYCHHI